MERELLVCLATPEVWTAGEDGDESVVESESRFEAKGATLGAAAQAMPDILDAGFANQRLFGVGSRSSR